MKRHEFNEVLFEEAIEALKERFNFEEECKPRQQKTDAQKKAAKAGEAPKKAPEQPKQKMEPAVKKPESEKKKKKKLCPPENKGARNSAVTTPAFSETLDFTRCQRPDGTYYGTGGVCRKGIEAGAKEKKPKKARVSRSSFDERTQDRLDGYIKKHNGRINKALGGSPFDDPDPNSEVYQRQAPKMKPYQKMTDDEKAALGMYGENVQEYYQSLNSRLRGGTSDQPDKLMDFMDSNLRGGLSKITPTEAQGITRVTNGVERKEPGSFKRAVSGDFAERMSGLKPGDVIQDDGFGSFTDKGGPTLDQFLSKDKGVSNAVISLAPGSKLRNISPVTEYNEGEHIAMPGTRYRVKSVNPTGHYSRRAGDVPMYTLEVID